MRSEGTLPNRTIDVSDLPSTCFDTSAPLWWGNTLLLFIETAMFGILIAIYFTVAMNLRPFPPPDGPASSMSGLLPMVPMMRLKRM